MNMLNWAKSDHEYMTEEFSDKGDTNITQKYSGSSL
jgi:hypothetical protein